MHPFEQHQQLLARRQFLTGSAMGLGAAALGNLVAQVHAADADVGSKNSATAAKAQSGLHFPAKAKRVIFLFMGGAPSQLDLYDYKPELQKQFREPLPPSVSMGQRVTAMTKGQSQLVAPSMFKFSPQGKSGLMMSELLPHLSGVADELCMIKSLHTNAINHDPAKTAICTGSEIPGKASMGAWLSYGLGRMNENLPDFIVLSSAFWSGDQQNIQALYSRLWGSGFLPSKHQGVSFQPTGDPVLFLSNPAGVNRDSRAKMLELVTRLNREHLDEVGDPEIQTTIAQQEMAFRMQASVPELTDLSQESAETLAMYGPDVEKSGSFARNCLLARRMIERDVRFVQLFHRGWDHHVGLPKKLRGQASDIDQPAAALIADLKQRGLLDETLIVCAGEFGRTTYCQGKLTATDYGRDHHPRCFTVWMAGGGIQGGMEYGQTDEFSYNIVENPVHVNDMNATILHQLGIDHNRLTFPFLGLDQKLTGVEEVHVVKDILA
ncbi:MAG: DUF1501 domain-containing protein [Pirellulaceae bacterium]|jgi:hypothetical protein|nr:DUF1501 domain-containing protein [Pirellulaceae bacterium]